MSHLSCAQSDHQISNEGIFSFSAPMTDHHSPAITLRQFTPSHKTANGTNKQLFEQFSNKNVK